MLGFEESFSVDARGRHSGGIAMIWRKHSEAKLLSYSNNLIDMEVSVEGHEMFRLTGMY